MTSRRGRIIGVALVLLSAFAWSLNGVYARFLTVDVWTTLVGRAIATVATLLVVLVVMHRRDTARVLLHNARIAIWVILAGAVTIVTFIAALFSTTVANVTVIYAMSPLFAALLARLLIGDPLVARTIVASVIAIAGVIIIVGGSFGTDRLVGDIFALLMAASFAVVMVEMRRKPSINNFASTFLSSLLLVVVLAPLATFGDITGRDAVVLFLFGVTSNVFGFLLFVTAVRLMPPAEAGLIAMVEVVLSPLWVWLLFAEVPGQAALLGGGVVVAAIAFQLSGELWRRDDPNRSIPDGRAAKVETAGDVV